MGDLSDPQVRAYLMGYAAVETFGLNEDRNEYATRMAAIGNTQGLQAEAEAIARDCKASGLEMSAARVLKALAYFQERHATRVTYLPDQNVLIVADAYAPGDDPIENARLALARAAGSPIVTDRGSGTARRVSKTADSLAIGLMWAVGIGGTLAAWFKYGFGTWSGIGLGFASAMVVAFVLDRLMPLTRRD